MATAEHCVYAFEALAANLERREPMDLEDVHKSWAAYHKSLGPGAADPTRPAKPLPALERLASPTSGASSSSSSTMSLAADTPATSVTSLPQEQEQEKAQEGDGATIRESPLFVTWDVIDDDDDRSLRGCIGTFEDQELEDGIASYAITAALHDTRFSPVRLSELPTLGVSVTLLTDFEDCDDKMDWTLGVHGLRISFVYHGRRHGATYLPDVAAEQGWTKEETLVSLMRKAGWVGRKDKWAEVELDCVRYQGKKKSLEFGEYKRWRGWVDETKWQA